MNTGVMLREYVFQLPILAALQLSSNAQTEVEPSYAALTNIVVNLLANNGVLMPLMTMEVKETADLSLKIVVMNSTLERVGVQERKIASL